MNEDKEYVIALRMMDSMIKHYLEGKLETEIAALLNIDEKEVVYVLSIDGKENIISLFEEHVWNAIVAQKEQNKVSLKKACQKDCLTMNEKDLRHIINFILLSGKETSEYYTFYDKDRISLLLHLLNEDYLISKLGKAKGNANYQQLCSKMNIAYFNQDPYSKIVLYLDSLFTEEEFIKYASLDKSFFQSLQTKIENAKILTLIEEHKQLVTNIRKSGNLPVGQYWIKNPHLRRILVSDVYHTTPKIASDLNVILAYYTYKGNIDKIEETQKRRKKEIIKITKSIYQYASFIQPYILRQLQIHNEVQYGHEERPHISFAPALEAIDYEKEVEQKMKWLKALAELGNIRPYYLCGELAIHNFSYEKTALDLGIDESQVEMANTLYMHYLTRTTQGCLFPFCYSYEILKYASTLYSIEKQKVKK